MRTPRSRGSRSRRHSRRPSRRLVIECVPERIDLKIRVFRDLDARAAPGTILASNTSGFPITALAAVRTAPTA